MEWESAAELLCRVRKRPDISPAFLDLDIHLVRTGLLEINGFSGSGKTLLTVEIVARCVLDHALGGCGGEEKDHIAEGEMRKFLDKVEVVQCFSFDQFILALQQLEMTLHNRPDVALICIDSVTAFHWSVMAKTSAYSADKPFAGNLAYAKLSDLIARIHAEFEIPVVVTRQTLFRNRQTGPSTSAKQEGVVDRATKTYHDDFMGTIWAKLPTVRVVTEISRVDGHLQGIVCDGNGENVYNLSREVFPTKLVRR
ncbi:hypothetical protein BV898_05497 [Hypsibius exemplaris]|uniref:DNA repair protein XRCC2 n=1 Tax=Hypsibius exemplaris TaxID=2072580 RepID=A0A1W0WZC2_HYPEX|nr:hypothetical protein BV898_05497 [Hypsibius exemplaris]